MVASPAFGRGGSFPGGVIREPRSVSYWAGVPLKYGGGGARTK